LDETFAQAMRSEGADDLLRLLRNIYFEQESTGSATSTKRPRRRSRQERSASLSRTSLAGAR